MNRLFYILPFFAVLTASAQDAGDVFRKYEARAGKAVDRGFEYLLSVEQPDGSYPLLTAEHVFHDYQFSTDHQIALPA